MTAPQPTLNIASDPAFDMPPNCAAAPTPRPGILDVQPYVGGERALPGGGQAIRLASNESSLGPSPAAVAAYKACADDLKHYPDGGADALRLAIARRYGLDAERIVCGAGSDELLALIARAYAGPGDEVLYNAHGFAMYPIATKTVGATPVVAPERGLTADVDAMLARVSDRTRVVFLANPNNPTGTMTPRDEVARLHAGLPRETVLVIDAAYAEYVTRNDYSDGVELVERFGNVAMTRTFSKIHALAALRLGWCYASAEVADVLNRMRGPFNVGAPAQAAGIAAIEDIAHIERVRAQTLRTLAAFRERALAIGLEAPQSHCNFLLVRFPDGVDGLRGCRAAYDHLVAHGVLVRRMAGYGLPDCLRVGIGSDGEMEAVARTLSAFMA